MSVETNLPFIFLSETENVILVLFQWLQHKILNPTLHVFLLISNRNPDILTGKNVSHK